ncbi:8686_t:CDS:2 [Gigaspora margarita]|uniref:8686_t:CDS:1 n=1 Tax=Gigaspora margarita TaxID=4874 RepID=A0ABM8VWX7_GIGMA|nr:8686_t:CDS:2 [Gigaspora margarita]
MNLPLNFVESSQFDSELLDIEDFYETSESYKTTDKEYSNNRPVVLNKQILKKKQIRGMNSKTILEKQTELANHPDVLEILNLLYVRCKHCKKHIKLKRNYKKSRIESHVSISNSQNKPPYDKRYLCSGLHEEKHLTYIKQVGSFTIFGGAPPTKENAISKPIPKPNNRHFTPKLYYKNNPLLKFLEDLNIKKLWTSVVSTKDNNSIPFWLKLAEKGLSRAFEFKTTFKGLYKIMIQIVQCEDYNKANSMNYSGPVIAMTNNTKLHPRLGYSANLGCIVGSTFSLEQTYVKDYNEIKLIIQNIISNNTVVKQQAWSFAKVLLIVKQDQSFNSLSISNEELNLFNYANDDYFDNASSNMSQSSDISDSHTIAIAANIVADSNSINIRDDNIEEDLKDARYELAFLLLNTNSSNQSLELNEDFNTGVKRRTIREIQLSDYTNSIHPNIVSSMIANCISNLELSVSQKLCKIR